MSPVQRTNRDQKGQTTVEYVLLIFVTIVVTLGLLRIFSSSVNIFTQNFFGSYVQCLIISGELPTLNSDSSSGCAMPQFVFDSGEFSQADNGGTDGGSSNGSNDSNKKKDKKDEGEKSESSSSNASGGAGGYSEASAQASSRSSRRPPARGLARTSGAKGSVGESKEKQKGGSLTSDLGASTGSDFDKSGGRTRYIYGDSEDEAIDKKDGAKLAPGPKEGGGDGGRPRTVAATTTNEKKLEVEEESGWNFGSLIKYIIIAAIAIALFLILGGQALEIKKGMDS